MRKKIVDKKTDVLNLRTQKIDALFSVLANTTSPAGRLFSRYTTTISQLEYSFDFLRTLLVRLQTPYRF